MQVQISEQAALLNVATDAIFVLDLENQILFWNKGAEHLYGWQVKEALGQLVNELLSKEISPSLEDARMILRASTSTVSTAPVQ